MSKINEAWTVGPHGPLERLDEGLLTVEGEIVMPLGRFPRRMTVVGLAGGRTAIWSPVSLREPEMREIEALGAPAFLIVPGASHRLDIKSWKQRYPAAQVVCAPGAHAAVSEIVPVDATTDVLGDPEVRFEVVPGTGEREACLVIRRGAATTLVVNDVLANVRHPPGLGAQVMARLFGFGVHRPRTPRIAKKMYLEDAQALAGAFRAWADKPGLARVVVSHGEVIEGDPAGALRLAAADLSA